ncbi:Thiol:disulfide interchange protein DsbC [hydrothermal vent metagenome]|uniref:Thiol:disulfide interchange protein DsbC n=1 Tax=hydrothermal vent metagenome TaxID=652676 RepID=A0A3B1BPP3_9ZZZZ
MRLFSKSILVVLVSSLFALSAVAGSNSELEKARRTISIKLGVPAKDIKASPVANLYLVSIPPRLFYISGDGKYVIDGDMIDVASKTNVTEGLRGQARIQAINNLGEDAMIIFNPKKGKLKHTITVFTDIDCPYCRKLHDNIEAYNALGIKVRYLAYPRAGIGSGSYDKAVAVWCASDRKKAMAMAMGKQVVKSEKCTNPVDAEFKLGNMIGVRGTPALVLENGQMVPGYVPPKRLAAILDQIAAK